MAPALMLLSSNLLSEPVRKEMEKLAKRGEREEGAKPPHL